MRKILALLSHSDAEFGGTQHGFLSTDNSQGGGNGSNSSGLLPGKQVSIENCRYTIDAIIAEDFYKNNCKSKNAVRALG
ncbi:unnamed protein product [Hymenolepis diminuta]|uniref:N-acetylmuramoyl-L-alanine amidase n=1 Tax=Hymenolepis diminuta TaxID=6216 RepID=A0A0R3SH95_HYMDI|nr:unnamed protein product [Hymenolepis diminuta]